MHGGRRAKFGLRMGGSTHGVVRNDGHRIWDDHTWAEGHATLTTAKHADGPAGSDPHKLHGSCTRAGRWAVGRVCCRAGAQGMRAVALSYSSSSNRIILQSMRALHFSSSIKNHEPLFVIQPVEVKKMHAKLGAFESIIMWASTWLHLLRAT
jgi:hypothetical protein